jgi:hypothetical protein
VSESKDTESRHSETDARASRVAQDLLNGQAGVLISKALNLAQGGDVAALRICVERILPLRKECAVSLKLRAVRSAADAMQLTGAIIEAMASGELTPGHAAQMARTIDCFVRTSITAGIERELEELQKALRDAESGQLGRRQ